MRLEDEQVHGLIDAVYAAALEPERWPSFLSAYARAVDGTWTGFHYFNSDGSIAGTRLFVNSDPEALADYDRYYGKVNAFRIYGRARIRDDVPQLGDQMCPMNLLRRTEYYSDFVHKHDVTQVMGGTALRDNGVLVRLSTFRSERQASFGRSEIAATTALLPHLQRAMQLHRRLASLAFTKKITCDVLDRADFGVVLLNAQGRTLLVNRRARLLLDARDPLFLDGAELRAVRVRSTEALRRLIADGVRTSMATGWNGGGCLRFSRVSGESSLAVLVAPLGRAGIPAGAGRAAVAVFLTDEADGASADASVLGGVYRLSRREADLALALLRGASVKEAAAVLGVSQATARTRLKHVFRKTRTSGQSDLLSMLSRGPTWLRMDDPS
jgi:DNA-binding CsgD family transcriptional regulator